MANILSYIKTIWKAGREGGTAWTHSRLNNIENGIEQATTQINTNTEAIEQATTQIIQNSKDIETINSNLSKKECGIVTTSGSVRTITLKGEYTDMKSIQLQIVNTSQEYYFVFSSNCKFTAPNKITFSFKQPADQNAATGSYTVAYSFEGI